VWIELESVTRRFGSRLALDRVDLSLERGEIGCLLGPSGSGKTSALRCIAGFESIDSGRIRCGGQLLSAPGLHVPPERRGIGVVFQDHALFPHLTVAGNVEFGLRALPRRDRRQRALELLERVGLAGRAQDWPAELSGGQQQRVAIARALAPGPAVLLLDEPFASLDPSLRERLVPELRALLKAQGTTALAVSHDQHDAFALADRVALLREGRIEQAGTPRELYARPATRFAAAFVGHACFLPALRGPGNRWSSEIGELEDSNPQQGIAQGERCELMLRPEDVQLDLAAPLRARVLDSRFRGADVLCTLELPSGRRLLAIAPGDREYPAGSAVGLRIAAVPRVAFPDGAA
jgi:iron(III) transport system ATP-binding protein